MANQLAVKRVLGPVLALIVVARHLAVVRMEPAQLPVLVTMVHRLVARPVERLATMVRDRAARHVRGIARAKTVVRTPVSAHATTVHALKTVCAAVLLVHALLREA